MHELGIGVTESLKQEADGSIILQPRPYSRTFMPKTDQDRLDAIKEIVEQEMAAFPAEWFEWLNRSR